MAKVKTLTALVEEASSIADESYNNKDWVTWFNNGLDDLSDILFLDKETTLTAVDGKFAVPTDLKSIINVAAGDYEELTALSYGDTTSTGYKVIEDSIILQGVGDDVPELTLYYYRTPAYLTTTDVTAPVDLPDSYIRALIYFACAQAMLKEDEPERYELFNGRFGEAKALIYRIAKMKRKGSSGVWQVVR